MTPNPMPAPAPQQEKGKSSVVIIVIIVGALFACCIVGILAAIAIPNFLKFQARSKQSECKVNLKAVYVGQMAVFSEKDDYGDTWKDIGFSPDAPRRYTYFMGEEATLPATLGSAVSETELPELAGGKLPGVYGDCPADCEFVAACAGSVDNDPGLDVWSVSSKPREKNGEQILAGQPYHDLDDIMQ